MLVNLVLTVWMVSTLMTACELGFALFVDRSDAFNTTNIAQRWTRLHIDAQRNALGYRDRVLLEKTVPAGKTRIGFIGDSFTMGHGIENMDDRFTDRIAAALEAKHPGKYTVNNLADLGLEIAQVEGRVRALFDEGYHFDVMVYVICLNDIEYYADLLEKKSAAANPQPKPSAQPFGAFLVNDTYFINWAYVRLSQFARPQVRNYYDHLKDAYTSDAWQPFAAHLDTMAGYCSGHQCELRVVIFPFVHNLGPDYPFKEAHAKIAAHCRANGVRILDLEPVFRTHAAENLTVNRYDAHPNSSAGHRSQRNPGATPRRLEPRFGQVMEQSRRGRFPDKPISRTTGPRSNGEPSALLCLAVLDVRRFIPPSARD